MERRVSLQKNCSNCCNSSSSFSLGEFSNDMTHDTGFCADTEDSKDTLKVMGLCNEDSDYNPIVTTIERHNSDRDLSAELTNQTQVCFDKNLKHKLSGECYRRLCLRKVCLKFDQNNNKTFKFFCFLYIANF